MKETFEQIVLEYQDRIFRLSFSFLRNRAAAEEITQEVLLRVWKGLPSFRHESSLSTWIYAITRNVCITVLGISIGTRLCLRDVTRRSINPSNYLFPLWICARISFSAQNQSSSGDPPCRPLFSQ